MKEVTLDTLFKRFLCVCAEELPLKEPGDMLLYKQQSKYKVNSFGAYRGFLLSYTLYCIVAKKPMKKFEEVGLEDNALGIKWEHENKFIQMNLMTGKVDIHVD